MQQGCRNQTTVNMMNDFRFDETFRSELRGSPHHYGEVAFLESVLQPGMTVIDGGANRGVTAVAIALAVGRNGHVYAFEPVPEYFGALTGNIARNRLVNITAHNLAICDRTGPLRFYKHGEGSGIAPCQDAEEIQVQGITLPEFLSDHGIRKVDFINLDCEGSELFIFRDAAAWLKEETPPIFCEVHRQYMEALGQSVDDTVTLLSELGYHVIPIQVEDLGAHSDFGQCSHLYATQVPQNRPFNNVLKETR